MEPKKKIKLSKWPLSFDIIGTNHQTKARAGELTLPHGKV